ncbi:MAG: ShlB/FhaC/HecB family hemolysin secretion/activation protein [Alphaproteobacteria bacterium]
MTKKLFLMLLPLAIIFCFNKQIIASGIEDSSNLYLQFNSINSLSDQIINQQLQQINLLNNQNSQNLFNYLKKNSLVNKSKLNDIKTTNNIDDQGFVRGNDILKQLKNNSSNCRYLKKIELENDSKIFEFNFKIIPQQQFIYKCLDQDLIIEIIKYYQQFLYDSGLVTSKISFNLFNAKKGILSLRINYGMIEKIIINNDNFFDKMQKYSAFGNLENKVLNINQINQGLIQINRLQINDAKLKIKAGSKNLYSDIIVENKAKFPLAVKLGYDNLGNNFNGYKRSSVDFNLQNILCLNDQISINYLTNLNDPNYQKNFQSIAGSINIPWHYNNFSYDYSLSNFKNTTQGYVIPITFSGFFKRQAFSYNRSIFRKNNYRISLSNSLIIKQSTSYINRQKIFSSIRRLSVLSLAVNFDINFKNNYHLYLKPSFNKGLKNFDAQKDQNNFDKSNPHAQFEYFKIYLNFTKKFTNHQKQNLFLFNSEIDLQKSRVTLYSMEQFSIGGYYSVRGFKDYSISGDSGYFWRNKLSFNFNNFKNFYTSKQSFDSINFINKATLEGFFDYGYVRNNYSWYKADGRLSGAGLKLIYNSKNFNYSLTSAYQLTQPFRTSSDKQKNNVINFEILCNL